MEDNEIIVTKVGKSFINKQLKGPAISLIGFVPFYIRDDIYNEGSNKSDLISDAMAGIFNDYYFNGIDYIFNDDKIVPLNKDESYINLFDLLGNDGLYKVKYTNTLNKDGENSSIYNLNLNVDNIKVDYSKGFLKPYLPINALAIFNKCNVVKTSSLSTDIELFAIIKFKDDVNLVENDINWTLSLNRNGSLTMDNFIDEIPVDLPSLEYTQKSNVYSSESFNIDNKHYTFSDNYYDNSKTLYYENGWALSFAKGGLHDYQYDITLLNNSSRDNGLFFNINPNTNTLEIQGTNRNSNIIFGVSGEEMSAKNSFIVKSRNLKAKNVDNIFNICSSGSYEDSNYIISLNSGEGNNIKNSNHISLFGSNNTIKDASNSFIRGNNNNVSSNGSFVVGDYNNAGADDSYIFGKYLSSNVPSSINFGNNYTNNDYSFVYSNYDKIYGLDKDYGNFVLNTKSNSSNVQISNDSIYLMDKFSTINPESSHYSLLVNTKNVSSDYSLIYGNYKNFQNSYILNSISIASALKTSNSINNSRYNSYVENSLDVAFYTNNLSSYNSILYGNIMSAKNGVNILNSFVYDLDATDGMINNSFILSADVSGKTNINQSLVVRNTSKEITNAYIQNSIIQGNTRNSTFINSHLIGDLPNGVNKEFKDCLVIADGSKYVEIYADEIVKTFGTEEVHIPWRYGLIKTYMDEECARGKEWKNDDINETYEDKVSTLLEKQKGFFRHCSNNDTIFAGKIPDGAKKCNCSMHISTSVTDFELDVVFDLNSNKVTYNATEVNIKNSTTVYINLTQHIGAHFTCAKSNDDNKIYIINKNFGEMFVVYKVCTCDILDIDATNYTKMDLVLADKAFYSYLVRSVTQNYNNTNYEFNEKTNHIISATNFSAVGKNGEATFSNNLNLTNIEIVDNTQLKTDLDYTNYTFKDISGYANLGAYLHSDVNPKITFQDKSTYTFDGMCTSSFGYDYAYKGDGTFDMYDVSSCKKNKDPLVSAYANRKKIGLMARGIDGLYIKEDTKFDGYYIDDMLINDYGLNVDDGDDCLRGINKFDHKDKHTFYGVAFFQNSQKTIEEKYYKCYASNYAISPYVTGMDNIYPLNDSNSKLLNFSKLILWGRIVNFCTYQYRFYINDDATNFFVDNDFHQFPLFAIHKDILPIIPLTTFIPFANEAEVFPFNAASYYISNSVSLNNTHGMMYLNLHNDNEKYTLWKRGSDTMSKRYYNPFVLSQSDGLAGVGAIHHEFSYIMSNKSTSIHKLNISNEHYRECKNYEKMPSSLKILRQGEYIYT